MRGRYSVSDVVYSLRERSGHQGIMPIHLPFAITSLTILVVSLIAFRPSLLQFLLFVPLWLSLILTASTAAAICYTVYIERQWSSSNPLRRHIHALRPLSFTTPSAWSAVQVRRQWEDNPSSTSFPSIHKSGSRALNERIEAIFKLVKSSFILPWYERISPTRAFPDAVEILARHILADLAKRGEAVDWSTLLVQRLVPLVTEHIHHYRTVEHLTSSSSSETTNQSLPLPLPKKTHPALSQQVHLPANTLSPSIEEHLRSWLERVFEQTLPEKDRSEVVQTMLREIVLGTVMMPVFDMLCDGDFWNRQIDEKGGRYLHEQ